MVKKTVTVLMMLVLVSALALAGQQKVAKVGPRRRSREMNQPGSAVCSAPRWQSRRQLRAQNLRRRTMITAATAGRAIT